jgi:ubiquinone/menaquinone biosynthesis methyltransferase
MSRFKLKAKRYIDRPERKLHYNRELFSAIAEEYSWMSGVLSFGRDRPWKREMIARLPDLEAPVCLDLASGNGDLTAFLLDRYPDARITALDLAAPMLTLQRRRFDGDGRVDFLEGDMTATGLDAQGYDLITVGYGLRNAPDLDRTLAEIARLLRPGGTLAALDFSRWNRFCRVELLLLRLWCGLWGILRSGNADTYGYIADSLAQYPLRRELHAMMESHRLEVVSGKLHFMGVIETLIVKKI